MKQSPRTRKVNEAVREAVSSILLDEISDPRLELVTVTAARVSTDLMVANIYVTAHGDEGRYAEVLAGLESAKGRIRSLLGQRVKMRFTPELTFFIDDTVDAGMRINEALKNVPPTLRQESDDFDESSESHDDTSPVESDPE